LALTSSIDIQSSEMAWEFSPVLGYQAPLWKLFLLWTLNVKTANLIASEFKPKHVVGQVEKQMV